MGNVRVIDPEAEGVTPCRYFTGIDDLGALGSVMEALERRAAESTESRDRKRALGMTEMAEWYEGRRALADEMRKMLLADMAARCEEREQEAAPRG